MWIDRLIKEYTAGKEELEKYRDNLDSRDPLQEEEQEIVESMISDMNFSLEWMKRGRRPGNRRGVDRRSVYQRTVLLEPDVFPTLDVEPKERRFSDDEKRKIIDILWLLSNRERQCFLLHMTHGMSYAEISKELNISRRTVQQYVERAREKLKNVAS